MYDLFGEHGAIRQIRAYVGHNVNWLYSRLISGTNADTKGTRKLWCMRNIYAAENMAYDKLLGHNVQGRYLYCNLQASNRDLPKRACVSERENEDGRIKKRKSADPSASCHVSRFHHRKYGLNDN